MTYPPEILTWLAETEAKRGIRILFAAESGSRSWRLESADSDYDVRFVYTHPLERYLDIHTPTEQIDAPIHNALDFVGWDLRKFMVHLGKCNPSVHNWLFTPIVYQQVPGVLPQLQALAHQYFNPKPSLHHYMGLAKKFFIEHLEGKEAQPVNVKAMFYILRPLLSADWILMHNTIPPVEFPELMAEVVPHYAIRSLIQNMLEKKRGLVEADAEPIPAALSVFIHSRFRDHEDYMKRIPPHAAVPAEPLGQFFRQMLGYEPRA